MATTIPMDGSMWVSMWYTSTTDIDALNTEIESILKKANFSILSETDYRFDPLGYTKLFLLAESHFAVHTWPEHHVAWLEIASCIEEKYDALLDAIKDSNLENLHLVHSTKNTPTQKA